MPPKAPTPKAPIKSENVGVTGQVCQQDGMCDKQKNIYSQQRLFPDDSQRQVSHLQAGKPTGLRVPSPSLGFFGRVCKSSFSDSLQFSDT